MQKCKYFDDLGLDITNYGTNFMPDDDGRAEEWAKDREEYGFDRRETWNLDNTFIEWIYSRVMMFKERNCIDLNFHRVKYKGTMITQGEAIDKILSLSKEYLLNRGNDDVRYENSMEICDLWKEVLPFMWW